MKLLSWNIAHRTRKLDAQVAALLERAPDVVALQEVIGSTRERLARGLAEGGLTHFACSLDGLPADQLVGPRRYGVAVASRWPIQAPPALQLPVPWPEKTLSCVIESALGPLELHVAYVPPGSTNGWTKIETFEGIHRALSTAKPIGHRLLCGDFNSPKEEHPDGSVVVWGQRRLGSGEVVDRGRRKAGQPGRWSKGERSVLLGLREADLRDIYRDLHGYGREGFSWVMKRKGKRWHRRYDHVFASASLVATRCEYLHEVRERGLSDHSMVEGVFGGG